MHPHAPQAINTVRAVFDKVTGYTENGMTEAQWLRRMIFLETIAGARVLAYLCAWMRPGARLVCASGGQHGPCWWRASKRSAQ